MNPQRATDVYEIRPRKDKRGFDLICDARPFGRPVGIIALIDEATGYN